MRDDECVRFLQWALPCLGLRWSGFRKVRRQVCRRIARRIADLRLGGLDAYRERLEVDDEEWRALDRMCRVTISRLWRDRETFRALETLVLPSVAEDARAAGATTLEVWSCGCASGEEPYSVAMLWRTRLADRFPDLALRVLATDVDLRLLQRAGRATYPAAATREVPEDVASAALSAADVNGHHVRIADHCRCGVYRVAHDVRDGAPGGLFRLILCRNLVFTYFDDEQRRKVGARLVDSLHPGGGLVLGSHESFPSGVPAVRDWPSARHVVQRERSVG